MPDHYSSDPAFRTMATLGLGGVQTRQGNPTASALPVLTAQQSDFPDLSTPYLPSYAAIQPKLAAPLAQTEALNNALAVKSMINEFLVDPKTNARTDFVFSMPTLRLNVGVDYRTKPFNLILTKFETAYFRPANGGMINGQLTFDVPSGQVFLRDGTIDSGSVFYVMAMENAFSFRLKGAATIMSLSGSNQPSVLGGKITQREPSLSYKDLSHWAAGALQSFINPPGSFINPLGLPVLGAAFTRASNPQVQPGISGNFGVMYQHHYQR